MSLSRVESTATETQLCQIAATRSHNWENAVSSGISAGLAQQINQSSFPDSNQAGNSSLCRTPSISISQSSSLASTSYADDQVQPQQMAVPSPVTSTYLMPVEASLREQRITQTSSFAWLNSSAEENYQSDHSPKQPTFTSEVANREMTNSSNHSNYSLETANAEQVPFSGHSYSPSLQSPVTPISDYNRNSSHTSLANSFNAFNHTSSASSVAAIAVVTSQFASHYLAANAAQFDSHVTSPKTTASISSVFPATVSPATTAFSYDQQTYSNDGYNRGTSDYANSRNQISDSSLSPSKRQKKQSHQAATASTLQVSPVSTPTPSSPAIQGYPQQVLSQWPPQHFPTTVAVSTTPTVSEPAISTPTPASNPTVSAFAGKSYHQQVFLQWPHQQFPTTAAVATTPTVPTPTN